MKLKNLMESEMFPKISAYFLILLFVSGVFYTVKMFKVYVLFTPVFSFSPILLLHILYLYILLSLSVISIAAWIKGSFGNLDRIKDHGILWYLVSFPFMMCAMAAILTVSVHIVNIIAGSVHGGNGTRIFMNVLISLEVLFTSLGFLVGTIFGLTYEFGKPK